MSVTIRAVTLTMAAMLGLAACSNSSGPSGMQFAMPSPASLYLDLALFDENSPASSGSTAGLAGSSFTSAAIAVNAARSTTFLVLAVPADVFSAATQYEPVLVDGSYRWDYFASGSGYAYEVALSARREGNQSLLEMRVTSATHLPPLTDFLWISGTATLAADEGEWHLFDANSPGTPTEILSVEWTYAFQASRSLTLTNANAASPNVGDKLDFVVDGFLRTLQFFDASEGTYTLVQWSSLSRAGGIVVSNVNGGQPACWNPNLENSSCTG